MPPHTDGDVVDSPSRASPPIASTARGKRVAVNAVQDEKEAEFDYQLRKQKFGAEVNGALLSAAAAATAANKHAASAAAAMQRVDDAHLEHRRARRRLATVAAWNPSADTNPAALNDNQPVARNSVQPEPTGNATPMDSTPSSPAIADDVDPATHHSTQPALRSAAPFSSWSQVVPLEGPLLTNLDLRAWARWILQLNGNPTPTPASALMAAAPAVDGIPSAGELRAILWASRCAVHARRVADATPSSSPPPTPSPVASPTPPQASPMLIDDNSPTPTEVTAIGIELCAGGAHLSRCARSVVGAADDVNVKLRTKRFIEKDSDDRRFISAHFAADKPHVFANFYSREWKSPSPGPLLDYALACPPCRIVAAPGKRRGANDADAEITISALAEVAQHHRVRWAAGEQHSNITTLDGGSVFHLFVDSMRAAGYVLVHIHERGRVVEHFTNAGHAVYRRRIGFLFELKTLDLGPCPPLAISDEPTTCIADHLSSTCDPSLLMSGVFTPRPYDEPVAGRMVVVGVLTVGVPDGPIQLGSRVIFKNAEEPRQFVVRELNGDIARLFHDNADDGGNLHDPVHVSLLRAVSFNVDVLHSHGIYGSFTFFGLPPLYGQKQLVMRNGTPSLLSAIEIASLHGDADAATGMIAAGMSERRASDGIGKSLVRNLATATVQRLADRIALAELVSSGKIQPHSERPELELGRSLAAPDTAGVYVAIVSLHPSTPVVFTDSAGAKLLRVVPHVQTRKSAVAAAEACVACLRSAIGVTPRCFYAGAMAPPDGPAVELVVCPTSLRVPFLFDGASWRTVNHVGALLRPLVLLSLATTLSMVDIQQGAYTYSIHDGHSARRINPIPIHDGHSARRIVPNSRRLQSPTN